MPDLDLLLCPGGGLSGLPVVAHAFLTPLVAWTLILLLRREANREVRRIRREVNRG
jgi:hypothetical protein